MSERFVENDGESLYPDNRGQNMPESEGEGLKPDAESSGGSSQGENNTNSEPKIQIPFDRARNALEVLSGLREGKPEVVDQQDLGGFKKLISDFSPKKEGEEDIDWEAETDPNKIILKLDEVISGAEIVVPTADELESVLKEKLEKEKLISGATTTDKEDEEALRLSLSNEITYALRLTQKAENFVDTRLTTEDLSGRLVLSDVSRFEKELEKIRKLKQIDMDHAKARVASLESTLTTKYQINGDVSEADYNRVMGETAIELASLKKAIGDESLRVQAERELRAGKSTRITRIYYGESTIPMAENFDPKGDNKDDFKVKSEETDKFLKDLIDNENLSDDQLKVLREQSKTVLDSFKEGGWKRTDILSAENQRELYLKLKEDQMGWLLEKLDELPLKDMDLSLVSGTIAYKEFINAMSKEMLDEVQEFAKGVSFGYEAKYYFENGGMDALIKKSGELQTSFEVVSQKIDGWDEVVAEIESLVTRKRLDREDDLAGLRADFNSELKAKLDSFAEHVSTTEGREPSKKEIEEAQARFVKEIKTEWLADDNEARASDWKTLEEGAVGLYVYEENNDGSIRSMVPKQLKDTETDRLILGEESWKVGGFVEVDPTKAKKTVDKVRDHLYTVAEEVVKAKYGDTKGYEARAKIAAFMGEWMFWRMAGRSAFWGCQGGAQKGEGGGLGEFQQFLVIGVQQYMVQESKGSGEVGRVMRKLMVGADTLDEYRSKYVPGVAGGQNFNVGFFDVYSQYTGFYPGERKPKPMQKAGYEVAGQVVKKGEVGFTRGFASGDEVSALMDFENKRYDELTKAGLGPDDAWAQIREELNDPLYISKHIKFDFSRIVGHEQSANKSFLDEYNNIPILTLASRGSRNALSKIAAGETRPWGDLTDYFGDDFNGPNALRKLIVTHDSGFLSNPSAGMMSEAAKLSEGRKRVWQRAKLMKDMGLSLLEFKSKWSKKLTGIDNWNTENADTFMTNLRQSGLIVERTKREIEKVYYNTVASTKGLAKFLPILREPWVHKFTFMAAKKPGNVSIAVLWEMIKDFLKRLPGQVGQGR